MTTSWFKLKDPNIVSHECHLQYLLECHIIGYHTDRHKQRKRVQQPVFLRGLRAGASGENVSRTTTGLGKGQWQSGVPIV